MDEVKVGLLRLRAFVDQLQAMRADMTDEEWERYNTEQGFVKNDKGLWTRPSDWPGWSSMPWRES